MAGGLNNHPGLESDTLTTPEQRIATIGLDLDLCESPEDAIGVLRRAADKFNGDAIELQSAWQDRQAERFWTRLARDLERLAAKADSYRD